MFALGLWLGVGALLSLPSPAASRAGSEVRSPGAPGNQEPQENGCLACHSAIEDMHPAAQLSCVDCHGGDASAADAARAHVTRPKGAGADERVAPEDKHLAWRRFRNPMDLRVAEATCGPCHGELVRHLEIGLHGTTAGHLSDGFYEVGLQDEKVSSYGVFPRTARQGESTAIERVVTPPAFNGLSDGGTLAEHFPDLVRKECMQCHLHSQGRAVRGRVGLDGDYRGEGCAACHVPYAVDGLSESADRNVPKGEPGHPRAHVMTRAPSTETCTSCHYGDASVGMHFRGFSQLPPGAAGGPEVPGTTDTLLNRAYYLSDPSMTPPDVHHERGMACVDCHTLGDVMGDGKLHSKMEDAVEISCEDCHGTFERISNRMTARGTPLTHLEELDGNIWLRSKVTGERHRIKQAVHVLDREHSDFNSKAADAMNGAHEGVECYTCHAGWNVNFLGFHFYRNAALEQLDLMTGLRTPGRVTTQEKVFSTWKSFYAGRNESGKVAPYLTGFSTMGTVDDKDGVRLLDQVLPETASGLSGLTMIHHQLHSTRPTARSCVECHRAPATWGLGSSNFRLARQVAYVADRRGIEAIALERGNLGASVPLAKFVLPDVVDLVLDCDPLQGHGRYLYASEGGRGVHVIDVSNPLAMRRVAFVECISPRGLALAGSFLYVADGVGGLRIFDVSDPAAIEAVGGAPMFDAHEVQVRWPHAYVADGPGGLAVVDVRAPNAPRVVGGLRISANENLADEAIDLEVLFQYSRPRASAAGTPMDVRSDARYLCAVLDAEQGLVLVDVTEPSAPVRLGARRGARSQGRSARRIRFRGLALRSHVDLAAPEGGTPTVERDYVYLLEELLLPNGDGRSFLGTYDVTNPERPRRVGRVPTGDQSQMLVHASFYNPPMLQPVALVAANDGLYVSDLSDSAAPNPLGVLSGLRNAYAIAVEEFPLDQMLDADGKPLKDVSHPKSRWMLRAEIEAILDVRPQEIGLGRRAAAAEPAPGDSARAYFLRHDTDRNGILVGAELEDSGDAFDADGDGRIVLGEVAERAAALDPPRGTTGSEEDEPAFLTSRVTADGDLARLFDGIDPRDFDRDNSFQLERKEASRALFAALDLDGDGRLNLAELSRHPGALRDLRYGDSAALEQFGHKDVNRGGTIAPRELRIQDAEWLALDADGDGGIQLDVPADRIDRRRGEAPPPKEWPERRSAPIALPPNVDGDQLREAFDGNGDGRITLRELGKRKDLAARLEARGRPALERDDLGRIVGEIQRLGVDACVDGFRARWDWDGDGAVDLEELPEPARTLVRVRGWKPPKKGR